MKKVYVKKHVYENIFWSFCLDLGEPKNVKNAIKSTLNEFLSIIILVIVNISSFF